MRDQTITEENMIININFVNSIPTDDYGKDNFNFHDYDENFLYRSKNSRKSIKTLVGGERRKYKLGGYERCGCGIMKRIGKDNFHIQNRYHKLFQKNIL